MPKPLFLEVDPQDRALILERFPEADIHSEELSADALVQVCADREVVCCFIYSKFTAEVLQKLPKLKVLCTRSVGFNHIDRAAAEKQGVTICNVPDYGSHVIAEHAFALLLAALRNIMQADRKVREGSFDYHGLRGMALKGKTIGIVGTGKIGRVTAKIAHGFGMRILAVDQCRVVELESLYGVEYVDTDRLYAESDIISLHVPALPETIHMINTAALKKMKKGVIIINTARGELVESQALLAALKSGKVSHALLDVLEHERDFKLNEELIKHPNVIVTPHIAFYADDSMHRMYLDSFQSIEEWQQGRPLTHRLQVPTVICDLPGVQVKAARR